VRAVETAEAWADEPTAAYAVGAANAAYAAANAADAAAYAADAAAYAAYVANANADADADAADVRLALLAALVDEYHRLRPGVGERDVTAQEWAELADALGTVETPA
jgi:hypothetical protein